MPIKSTLMKFFAIGLLSLAAYNPVSGRIVAAFSAYGASYPVAYALLLLILYGLYLEFGRAHEKKHRAACFFACAGAAIVAGLGWPFFLSLALLGLFFSLMRVCILEQPRSTLWQDIVFTWGGFFAFLLLLPLGTGLAALSFFLVQFIYETALMEKNGTQTFKPDRFQESYRTADALLKKRQVV